MYALKICLLTDGDFGYEDTEFHIEPDVERIFYFRERYDAALAFKRHFHSVRNSLKTFGRDYIIEWFNAWAERIDWITQNIETFNIEKCFGNQEVSYTLYEVEKHILDNGLLVFMGIPFLWTYLFMLKKILTGIGLDECRLLPSGQLLLRE